MQIKWYVLLLKIWNSHIKKLQMKNIVQISN